MRNRTERFGENIRDLLNGWNEVNGDFSAVKYLTNEWISNVDVFCALMLNGILGHKESLSIVG